ncbi:hypothetical protein [Mycobacterium sp. GA-2829]|uniref:hypothetical protein n=1 Tax=Mycobacterium sp. GA-2829 TaxID=1772283 RepID=UPI0012FBCBBC|nr:hypothetical protein [Mycobacterium sp. GA-2829]
MPRFLMAVTAVVAAVAAIGTARLVLANTVWGDRTVQRSCAPEASPVSGFCAERHVYPGIPLLRDERRTVEIRPDKSPRIYSVADPFWDVPTITWREDGVSLVSASGYALTFDARLLHSIGA